MQEIKPLSVRENFVWNTVGCLMYQGCLWLTTVAVVLLSDYSNSGALAYGMAIGNIFNPIATYNMRTYQVSDVRNRYSTGNYVAFRLVTIVLALAMMAVYSALTVGTASLLVTVACYLVFKTDEAFCSVYYAVVQRRGRMDFIGISQGVRGLIIIALFSLGLVLTHDVNLAVIAMSIGCIVVTFAYDLRKAALIDDVHPHIEKGTCLSMLRECLPAVLTMLCFGSVVSVARQLFGNTYGPEALGIYAAIATPTVIIQVAASYLTSPFLVTLAEKSDSGDARGFVRMIARIVGGIVVVFAVVMAAALLVGTPLLVRLYGEGIAEYCYLFPHVIAATGTVALAGFMMDVLVILRELNWSLVANGTALVTCFLASGPIVSAYYMDGINIVVLISFGLALVVSAATIVRRTLRLGEGAGR